MVQLAVHVVAEGPRFTTHELVEGPGNSDALASESDKY